MPARLALPPRLLAYLTAALALLAAAVQPPPAQAQGTERQARLSLHIEMSRQAGRLNGGPPAQAGQGASAHTVLDYSVTLLSDGVPGVANPLDPADTGRQQATAQARQARVDSALQRSAARQGELARRGGEPATMPAPDPAALQAQAQALLARCGQDQDCLVREAARLGTAQLAAQPGRTLGAADQARLQGYAEAWRACERQHPAGAQRQACQATARRQAGGQDDPTDSDDDGPATPYLFWRSDERCRAPFQLSVDERREGRFIDVPGELGVVATRQARQASPQALPCGAQQLVVDQRNGRLWAAAALLPLSAPGRSTRQEQNRPLRVSEGAQAPDWFEAGDWLQARLNRLSREGSDEAVLPLGGAEPGELRIRLQWRFSELH